MAGPVVEQTVGTCYIWVICIVLTGCLATGGTLLWLYMANPDNPSVSSYPVIGICLIGLPWLFWFITVIYRLLSRKFGFRMVFWGASLESLPRSSSSGSSSSGETNNPGGKEQSEAM